MDRHGRLRGGGVQEEFEHDGEIFEESRTDERRGGVEDAFEEILAKGQAREGVEDDDGQGLVALEEGDQVGNDSLDPK